MTFKFTVNQYGQLSWRQMGFLLLYARNFFNFYSCASLHSHFCVVSSSANKRLCDAINCGKDGSERWRCRSRKVWWHVFVAHLTKEETLVPKWCHFLSTVQYMYAWCACWCCCAVPGAAPQLADGSFTISSSSSHTADDTRHVQIYWQVRTHLLWKNSLTLPCFALPCL